MRAMPVGFLTEERERRSLVRAGRATDSRRVAFAARPIRAAAEDSLVA